MAFHDEEYIDDLYQALERAYKDLLEIADFMAIHEEQEAYELVLKASDRIKEAI